MYNINIYERERETHTHTHTQEREHNHFDEILVVTNLTLQLRYPD